METVPQPATTDEQSVGATVATLLMVAACIVAVILVPVLATLPLFVKIALCIAVPSIIGSSIEALRND